MLYKVVAAAKDCSGVAWSAARMALPEKVCMAGGAANNVH